MSSLTYTNPAEVTAVRADATYPRNPYAQGYGPKIPTPYWIHYLGYWRRVYVMCWSNSGTAYVLVKGERHILDIDTEYRLKEV